MGFLTKHEACGDVCKHLVRFYEFCGIRVEYKNKKPLKMHIWKVDKIT